MIMDKAKQDHFIDLIYMLVNDQPMEFVDEKVKLVLALNLIMLFREYLLLNF